MAAILRVQNLSKVYRLGELNRGVFFSDLKRKLAGDFTELDETDPSLFWALRDNTFEVQEGEVVGLLGRNGAGKSTLLKVLAQITAPTLGWVGLRGRVASLLEVGTGFHPDLSGRDNIFLNGNILGMNRREVQSKYDEILDFSGVEEFIDTPVKRYSVGMRVRLAFAVAAHLEPEVLLVDEVLAVGDVAFQKKCLGKIGEVSRSGRTVIFVSHNSATIEALCTRGIVLEGGRLVFDGSTKDAIEFSAATRSTSAQQLHAEEKRAGTGEVRVTAVHFHSGQSDGGSPAPRAGQPLTVELHFERRSAAAFSRLAAQITVSTYLGVPIFTQANFLTGDSFGALPERGVLRCAIPRLPLAEGRYQVGVRLLGEMRPGSLLIDEVETAGELHVEAADFFGTGRLPGPRDGSTLVEGTWSLQPPVLASPVKTGELTSLP